MEDLHMRPILSFIRAILLGLAVTFLPCGTTWTLLAIGIYCDKRAMPHRQADPTFYVPEDFVADFVADFA